MHRLVRTKGRVIARRLRGLGDICTVTPTGARVCGPSVAVAAPAIGNPYTPNLVVPGTGTMTVAQLWALAQSAPQYLMGSQIKALQGAGLLPINFEPNTEASTRNANFVTQFLHATAGGVGSSMGSQSSASAALILQYQTNPGTLTAAQWTQLQNAGVIPTTMPYTPGGAVQAVAPSAAIDYSAVGSSISLTDPTTWPWYLWAAVAGGAYFLFAKKGR